MRPPLHPPYPRRHQAESREHRRWIERFNAKLREKGKREETRRLREFVDSAWRQDPRCVRGAWGATRGGREALWRAG